VTALACLYASFSASLALIFVCSELKFHCDGRFGSQELKTDLASRSCSIPKLEILWRLAFVAKLLALPAK